MNPFERSLQILKLPPWNFAIKHLIYRSLNVHLHRLKYRCPDTLATYCSCLKRANRNLIGHKKSTACYVFCDELKFSLYGAGRHQTISRSKREKCGSDYWVGKKVMPDDEVLEVEGLLTEHTGHEHRAEHLHDITR